LSAGGCPVPRNDVNGALNQLSQDFAFRQDGGVWEWSALADYDVGRLVRGSDNLLYRSKAQSGPSIPAGARNPTTDNGTYWTAVPLNDADVVHKSGSETITGDKTFAQSSVVINSTDSNSKVILGGTSTPGIRLAANNFGLSDPGAKIDLNGQSASGSFPGGWLLWADNGDASTRWWLGASANNSNLMTSTPKAFAFINVLENYSKSIGTSTEINSNFELRDTNGDPLVYIQRRILTNKATALLFTINKTNNTVASVACSGTSDGFASFSPLADGGFDLGNANSRWAHEYFATAPNVSSDARLKTEPQEFPDAVLDAWGDADFCQYQLLDSVAEKGADKARLHSGLIAQRIEEAFKARGLDARRYGLFCWDEWDAVPEERDEDGNVAQEARPAGDMFSLRYEEALCMEAAYQRRRADRAEARIAALEERLAAIEAKLG
jgi:hypothetical protein